MFTVRSLGEVLELRQRLNVGGVFLVIVTSTYATLNDLLLHHRHPQYTPSCLLRQFSEKQEQTLESDQRVDCQEQHHKGSRLKS